MIDRYFDAILGKLSDLMRDEADSIREAASVCAQAIASGGVVHVFDTGHMLNQELIGRAGGLVGLTPFSFGLNVSNPNSYREQHRDRRPETERELVALALKSSNILAGDVLVIGSVSGKSVRPIELAMQARALGVTVVAVTAVEYSRQLKSEHPSGKKLYETADIVVDNHAPYGDALLEVEGLDTRICPASGICAAVAMWAVMAGTIEKLIASGKIPAVYPSVNLPDGPDRVHKAQKEYAEKGI